MAIPAEGKVLDFDPTALFSSSGASLIVGKYGGLDLQPSFNYCTNPRPAGTGGWRSGDAASYAVTRVYDPARRLGGTSVKIVRSEASPTAVIASLVGIGGSQTNPALTTGVPQINTLGTYRTSVWVRSDVAGAQAVLTAKVGGTVAVPKEVITSPVTPLVADTFVEVVLEIAYASGVTPNVHLDLVVSLATGVSEAGMTTWVTDAAITTAPEYFDGSDWAIGGEWMNTSNASPSRIRPIIGVAGARRNANLRFGATGKAILTSVPAEATVALILSQPTDARSVTNVKLIDVAGLAVRINLRADDMDLYLTDSAGVQQGETHVVTRGGRKVVLLRLHSSGLVQLDSGPSSIEVTGLPATLQGLTLRHCAVDRFIVWDRAFDDAEAQEATLALLDTLMTTRTASWEPPTHSDTPVTGYTVRQFEPSWSEVVETSLPADATSLAFRGLAGVVQVLAVNSNGISTPVEIPYS